jgi:predicted nucleic acid-binding protein
MTWVVDASVVAKWFLTEPDSEAALALLGAAFDPLLAPDLVIAEVANALWHKARRGDIGLAPAQEAVANLHAHFDEIVPASALAPRALSIAVELRHPVYDCFYLALAEARGAGFVTADRRLHAAVQGTPWAKLTRLLA